jgi:autonomous glycyl radical cofactor GrcA
MDDRLMQPHGARDELIAARSNKSSLLNCFKIVPENAEEATQLAKRQQSSDQPVPVPEAGRLVRREARLVQSNEFKVVAR